MCVGRGKGVGDKNMPKSAIKPFFQLIVTKLDA